MAKGIFERAEQVAAGRRGASAAELVELVRAVNPTGRELPAKTESERYRLKSRLQSLLVNQFGADLRVERTADPGVVGLFHSLSGADACHARIDDLDEDARAWVRFQLDTEGDGVQVRAPGKREPEEARPLSDPLSRGRRFVDEYDFEAARVSFEEAMAGGSAEAGVALLEMLVDSLGDFQAAVELEPRLEKPDAHVRVLLALALARTGARVEARRRVTSLEDPRLAEVWAALVAGALADGNLDEAAALASDARARELRHPELVEAEAALARRLAENRAPDEKRLQEAWERGDEVEAERIAREVGGATAGRILRELEKRRREAEGRRLLEEAREVLARGDDATDAARRAAHLGVSDPAVDAAIAARASGIRERKRQERVEWIVERIGEREGLRAFLEADSEMREGVRRACDRPLLRWAEAMGSAEAALALEGGEGLERHDALLSKIPEGREALRRAREAAAERVRAAAEAALVEAVERASAGDAADAMERLEKLDARALTGSSRDQAEALLARLRKEQSEARRAERVAAASRAGDRLEALLLAREGGDAWHERSTAFAAELAQEWHFSSFDCDLELSAAEIPALEEAAWSSEVLVLSPGPGGSLFLPVRAGVWTIIFQIDVDRGRIQRVLRICAPLGLGYPSCVLDGRSLWIIGSELLVELEVATFEILGGLRVRDFVPAAEEPHDALLIAGTPWCWLESEVRSSNENRARVLDIRQRRMRCEMTEIFPAHVQGTNRVFSSPVNGASRLYEARGTADARVNLPADAQHLCAHPSAPGFIALTGGDTADDGSDEVGDLEIAVLSEDGKIRSRQRIPDAAPERIAQLAASSETGLVFAIFFTSAEGDDARELLAWRTRGSELDLIWTVPVSRNSALATDSRGQRAVLVAGGEGGISLRALGATPPEIPSIVLHPRYFDFPDVAPPFFCRRRTTASQLNPAELLALRGNRGDFERAASKLLKDPAELGVFLAALHRKEHREMADELLAAAEELHPAHVELELARAELELADGLHAEAVKRLRSLEGKELSISPRHLAHVLGLAQFFAADAEAARATWTNATEVAGDCALDRCVALVSPEGTPLGQLAAAIRAADATQDPSERKRILAPHWTADETQSRVRYAAAWLARDAKHELDVTRKLAAVGWLPAYKCSRDLPLPGAEWSRARILAVTGEAIAWLEGLI